MTRPESMIHKFYYVIPPSARPNAKGDFSNNIKEDGLTVKMAYVIKANNRIKKLQTQDNKL